MEDSLDDEPPVDNDRDDWTTDPDGDDVTSPFLAALALVLLRSLYLMISFVFLNERKRPEIEESNRKASS